jgi:uncharacterized protein YdbL (DUF1318 family)
MTEIKIFLASSNELKEDRNEIEMAIRRLNDDWQQENKPYLNLEIWEEVSEAMSATGRSQEEYNRIIQMVDIFVLLFWTKVGKYTHEEFSLAKQLFQKTGKPQVIVYQKFAPPEKQAQSLKDFINSLTVNPQDEYFCGQYEHIDTLLRKLEKEIVNYYKKHFSPKTPTEMLASTLFTALLATYQSGALDFVKEIGIETAKDIAKDTLKSLGEKVTNYFKGKKEEDTFDALENSVTKQNTEKFKAKSGEVLELLKSAVENDASFKQEVESILNLNGLDKAKQEELAKATGQVVHNVSNITGNNNVNIQGNNNSTITINGDYVGRDKIGKQINK